MVRESCVWLAAAQCLHHMSVTTKQHLQAQQPENTMHGHEWMCEIKKTY